MKLQTIAEVPPAMAQPLAEQAQSGTPSAQAAGQTALPDAALREALPSRRAGEGAGRAGRTGMSVLRSIANTSQSSSFHRLQAIAVRPSEDMQIEGDGTESAIALPDEFDGAIADDWANATVGNARVQSSADAQVPEQPSHRRVSRDDRRQRQRGQQPPQQQDDQEPTILLAEAGDGKRSAQTRTEGLADQTQPSDQPPATGFADESPWALQPVAFTTARIAPNAAPGPARRHVAELDPIFDAQPSSSDTASPLTWALAAIVVVMLIPILFAAFSAYEADTEKTRTRTDNADQGSLEAPRRDERRPREEK